MKYCNFLKAFLALCLAITAFPASAQPAPNPLMDIPPVVSSWNDLTEGLNTKEDWESRRPHIKQQFLDLLRDQYKPEKPPLDFQVHESVVVDDATTPTAWASRSSAPCPACMWSSPSTPSPPL